VTSIATGIATVSLLDQAPPRVTQVINRVVERTVEQVVPQQAASPAQVVTKEETVVVREDELITQSIADASDSIVRVFARRGNFIAMGFVANRDGLIVTSGEGINERGQYEVVFPTGERVDAEVVLHNDEASVALLRIGDADTALIPAAVNSGQNIQLGSTVLIVNGEVDDQVAMGIISRLDRTSVSQGGVDEPITGLHTNLAPDLIALGTPLFSLFGEVIGVRTSATTSVFVPMSVIQTLINSANT
jgi:S1-C subfamily serine protease